MSSIKSTSSKSIKTPTKKITHERGRGKKNKTKKRKKKERERANSTLSSFNLLALDDNLFANVDFF
jgi:hypothetical protein